MTAEQAPELQTEEWSEAGVREDSATGPSGADSKERGSFVVFGLDGERFALPLNQVEIALRMVALTPVPDAPRWVSGVIDLHGRVVPVADLRQRLGRPTKECRRNDRLLVMSLADRTFAIVVDEVLEVLDLSDSEVETPPDPLGDSRYLKAVVRREDGLILILDSASLFPMSE